jgi:glycosyltransferase involved in cell wall biosynthesis
LHIVLIAHVFGFNDGQGRVNYEIARAAIRSGLELTLIGERCAEELAGHPGVRFIPIPTSSLPTRFLKNLSFAVRSSRWLKRNRRRGDVVQANGFVTFAGVDVAAAHFVHGAWLKSPYSTTSGGKGLIRRAYQRIYTRLNSALEQMVYSRAERIVAVSDRVAEELRSVGVPKDKIVTIFNGVDTDEFSPRIGRRSDFTLPSEVVLFLFAGDIRTGRKNLDSVLRAIAEWKEVHLAVAGSKAGSPYPALAASLGIEERVHFLGHTARMSELMAAVDGFIFPSRYDPLGLVVLEAMATGLPVITAETTGASAILNAPEWTLKDPDDVPALTRMIGLLAQDAGLRKRLAETNRSTALNHRWTSMASRYLDLYRSISERDANPAETTGTDTKTSLSAR